VIQIMKRKVEKYDFKALGQAIKEARNAKGMSRNQLADMMNIAPRYIASIENSGQHPSLQIFYELVTVLDVSVDQFFFPNKKVDKSTQRRQLDSLLDEMDDNDLIIMTATAKGILETKSGERMES
jgi:transcriptional regulator with XRE-family HTH domain